MKSKVDAVERFIVIIAHKRYRKMCMLPNDEVQSISILIELQFYEL